MSEEYEPNYSICTICGERAFYIEVCDICGEIYCENCTEECFVKCELCGKRACRGCLEYLYDEDVFVCPEDCKEEWLKLTIEKE